MEDVADCTGIRLSRLVSVNQVHGSEVAAASIEIATGNASVDPTTADAIVTQENEIGLVVKTADCMPIAIASQTGLVAAVHAGWRGAVAGVVEATVRLMAEIGQPAVRAAIGPCIRQCCFEVGPDVASKFENHVTLRGEEESHGYVDLPGWILSRLQQIGVVVDDCGLCTCCSGGVFNSYRRDGAAAGRQFMLVRANGGADG